MEQTWLSDAEGSLGGVPVRYVSDDFATRKTSEAEIVVLKPASVVRQYAELSPNPRRIIEIGVHQGGSALLMADMFPQAAILGIDWARGNPAIAHHMDRLGYSRRMRLHFGVSQDDATKLPEIVGRAFGTGGPDLIIDDASHNYGYTTRCFDILFPLLQVGGLYVIEDWGWSYWPGFQPIASLTEGGVPLSRMVHELVAASAIFGAIEIVRLNRTLLVVRKLGELPPFEEIRAAFSES